MASAATAVSNSPPCSPGTRRPRNYHIGRVAVLGAGTMGARIAAHFANAGVPVLLLDMVPATGGRNSLASRALQNLSASRPPSLATLATAALVNIGNFEDDLPRLRECDWVIEAVAENLEIKRSLLGKVSQHLHSNAILTTNTSGLPIAKVAEQLPADVRRRWFGTHFFNPPRYMRLLEIIATPESDPEAVAVVSDFAECQLGKTVVPANDVQNFIANRIGIFVLIDIVKIMQEQALSIEEVDQLTGNVIGWPKTGTFRLIDMIGLDVLRSIVCNFAAATLDERSDVPLPKVIDTMIERKWLGDKTQQGFYKKGRSDQGKEIRSVLDVKTLDYNPEATASFPNVELAKKSDSLAERLGILLQGDPLNDKAAKFYWQVLPEIWAYAANRIGEVAETLVDIDRAMTAGFNWELGPFALWDAAGFLPIVDRMRVSGMVIPRAAEKLLAAGGVSWYRADGNEYFDIVSGTYKRVPTKPGSASIASFKHSKGVLAGNADISLVDLGEGIGCFELHSKMNALGGGIISFLQNELRPGSDAMRIFDGFVISTDAVNFSVGANLKQLLLSAQGQKWGEIEEFIQQFQAMTQAIKFSPKPVVAAPAGLCLGGGYELCQHTALTQSHFELYAGLVETGVGLLPAGGGCKEMLLRAISDASKVRLAARGESVEIMETVRSVFETIVMAKVSTSAKDALSLRLLHEADGISMNRSRLIHDAKQQALRLLQRGYITPLVRSGIPAPGATVMANLKLSIYLLREGEYISDHDAKVATHVARVLSGGDIAPGTHLSEQHLLDLEREAFVSLCGEAKTIERIAFTLSTGKPLKN